VKNFRATCVFQGKRKLLEILNDKKYIFSTVTSGQTLFSGQAKVAQKSWMIKIFQYSEKFQGNSCFSVQAQVAQKSWMKKIFQYSEKCQGNSVF